MTEIEIMQRAKMYMDKLSQGVDPVTDEEMPEDSVLNNVKLARCFFYVSGVLQQVINNGGIVSGKAPKIKKVDFAITPEQITKIEIPRYPIRITEFVEMLNDAVDAPEMKKLKTTKITDWLLEKGFLYKEPDPDGKSRRMPTEEGKKLGLTTAPRRGPAGDQMAVYYSRQAQMFLLDNLEAILQNK